MDMKTYMHRLQEVVPYSTRGQQAATLRTVDELRAKVSGRLVEITPSWLVDAAPLACDHHPGRQCADACDVCLSLEGLGWRRAEIDQAAADMEVFDVR